MLLLGNYVTTNAIISTCIFVIVVNTCCGVSRIDTSKLGFPVVGAMMHDCIMFSQVRYLVTMNGNMLHDSQLC